MYGQGKTRGNVGLLKIEAATNRACGVLRPNATFNSVYLFFALKIRYDDLRNLGRGGNQENLNLDIIRNFEVSLPPQKLQNHFEKKIAIYNRIIKRFPDCYSNALFQSLLQKAFTGELMHE